VLTGYLYKNVIDPLLRGVHQSTLEMIPPGIDILDIACGTGSFAQLMCSKDRHVSGIDISEVMINTAERSKASKGIHNLSYYLADATDLSQFHNDQFDLATLSLAIHQFSEEDRNIILGQVKRVASEILIIDYTSPLPRNGFRHLVSVLERLAGKSHYINFRQYQKQGGIPFYADKNNLSINEKNTSGRGIFTLALCK
jgi:demethylmenaquinone methyltransferase/2-methoxy-6-polyprenyl-1,4-benzoquinol methylase